VKWVKKGLIFSVDDLNHFAYSHCHKPTPLVIDDKTIRIYFGVRDKDSKTRTTFIDVDKNNPSEVKYVHDKPVLDLGKIGAFDDSGANVCSVVRHGEDIYMYFIGWNPSTTVHTRNAIGMAISKDNGLTFNRVYDGSILDRNKEEPYYTGAVDVRRESDDVWRMWYTSGTEWKMVNNKPEIWYHIKYAHSLDGIDWVRDNVLCIPPSNPLEATARPSVIFKDGKYMMWFSKRSISGFRTNKQAQYRAGYAESKDGIKWTRTDEKSGIDVSGEGWDSEAIAYPYVIDAGDRFLMFYNGNGFGKSGFGYAEHIK
jgi:predicted GH43/DUF377 family glycosyl hydrolase